MVSNLHFTLLSSVGDKRVTLGSLLRKLLAFLGSWVVARGLLSCGGVSSWPAFRFEKENDRRPNDFIMIETPIYLVTICTDQRKRYDLLLEASLLTVNDNKGDLGSSGH